jgi:Skp family chaperone for outer membrane proteins
MAYVEETVLLKALKGYEQNTKTLDSLKQVYAQETANAKKELEQKVATLMTPYNFSNAESMETIKAKLKPADADRLALYTKENELLTKVNANYQLVLKTIYEQKVQPLLDKLNTLIANYAKAQDIKMIYTLEKIAPSLAYLDKGMDITPEILKLLQNNSRQ